MKRKWFVLWVMVMSIFSFLFGCGNKNDGNTQEFDGPAAGTTAPAAATEAKEITPVEFSEGVTLTVFFMNRMGMAREPYYIMKVTESGTYMKISDLSPDDYNMWKDGEPENPEQPAEYFGYIETVKDIEYASHVKLEDESLIRRMEEIVVTYGALGWDGFCEREDMPGVLDSGNSYDLYLELSDGTTVTVDGYNSAPKGFNEFYMEMVEIFRNNSDYSRYLATDFSASPCTYLEVELRDKEDLDVYYQIRFRDTSNQWSITLNDPDGMILEKGTEISGYKEIEEKLPYERFLKIMSAHGVEEWNQYEESTSSSAGQFYIAMYFADGKEFLASGNVYPEGFEKFKAEFVKEIYDFYKEIH